MTDIAAHRAGAGLWPENSPTAFRNVTALPVDFVEFDVHRTGDGVLVVHHDATIDRMTTGSGPIAEFSWAELQRHRIKGTEADGIPTLAQVVETLSPSPARLRVELKVDAGGRPYAGLEQEVADALDALGVLARVTFTSFSSAILARLAAVAPERPRILLVARTHDLGGDAPARLAREAAATELAVHVSMLAGGKRPPALEATGMPWGVYAANSPAEIGHALALGVSAFTTDWPDIALRMRGR
jgi:glycerophosphoryl diester phosphodiesterase